MEEKLSDSSIILARLEETRIGKDVPAEDPKVSVIIPAYNISAEVVKTLDSVFNQTFEDYEVIVINDGSEDTSELESAIEPYFDRLVYGRQKNMGAARARNAAICLSRGELIAFLDGDDIWLPSCLERQVEFLEKNKLDMVYCDAELFGENYLGGNTYMETTPSTGEVNPVSLITAACNVITSGTMLRQETLAEVGMFDTESDGSEDFDLWFRIAKYGARIGYQRNVLLKYRLSPTSLSGSNIQRAERNIEILDRVRKKHDLTPEEIRAQENQLEFSKAEVELEKAKLNLITGNYAQARRQISRANQYYKKPKLFFLNMFLKVSPGLAVKLFKMLRPSEFSFIATGKD